MTDLLILHSSSPETRPHLNKIWVDFLWCLLFPSAVKPVIKGSISWTGQSRYTPVFRSPQSNLTRQTEVYLYTWFTHGHLSVSLSGYFYSANKNAWQGGSFSRNSVCRERNTAGKINNVINYCEILPECELNPHVSYNSYSGKSRSFCCSPQFDCARLRSLWSSLMCRASGFRHNRLYLSLSGIPVHFQSWNESFQWVQTIMLCFVEPC